MTLLEFRKEAESLIFRWLKTEGIEDVIPSFSIPPSDELGDLSTPVAMSLTKHLKTSPVLIADRIKNEVKPINLIQKIEVAKPGYINFFVNKNKLMKLTIQEMIEKRQRYGKYSSKTFKSSFVELMVWVAPHFFANSSFSSLISTAITGYACISDAIFIDDNPIPPAPITTTDCSALTFAV